MEKIKVDLDGLGVEHGMNSAEMEKAVTSLEDQEWVIAEGTYPKMGSNGWVDFHVVFKEERATPYEKMDGKVDYHEIREIPDVKEGQLIGNRSKQQY